MSLHDPHVFVFKHNLDIDSSQNIAFVDLNEPPIDCSQYDFVFFYWMENIKDPLETYLQYLRTTYRNNNIAVITSGMRNEDLEQGLPSNVLLNPDWLYQTVHFNRFQLDHTSQTINKPYCFDALLGLVKHERLYLYNRIQQHPHRDRFLMNIDMPGYFSQAVYDLEIDEIKRVKSSPEFNNLPRFSMTRLSDDYYRAFISQVMPMGIYNASWYSITCETEAHNFFLTEKTVKTMLARRVYIGFNCQYFLRYLKQLGFQTFSTVIDESYDNESRQDIRFDMAWNQVEQLLAQDPQQVYSQCQPVLDHNYNLCLNLDHWNQRIKTFVNQNL
jgi:hypothetical protein